jgi:MFS family permease
VSAALRRSFTSLAIPNYRRYFAGQLVSLSGNWMQVVAEMWLVLSLTNSPLAVGVTSALQFVPMLLFGAFGGLAADRLPKRSLLIVTQALMALPALALWAVTATGAVTPALVFALVFARGAVNAFDNPARQSFVMEMVGAERVVSAVGLNSVLIHSARIVGPALAGVIIATVGVQLCFLVNAASFGAMIVALRAMDPDELEPAPPATREPGALRAALRYVVRTPELAIPLAMMAVVGTLGFNFQVILPLLARFTFDGGATTYTALAVAMAVGSVAGALASGARGRVGPAVLIAASLGFGVLAALAALAPSLPLEMLVLVPLGAASVTFAAGVNSSLQLAVEPSMRGRVMALYSVVFLGSTPIGGPIAGWLAQTAGPRAALFLTAASALVAAAGARFALSRLASAHAREVALQPRRANQLDGLQRRARLDVEAHPVALLDRDHGPLPVAPGHGVQDREPRPDRHHLRPQPGQPAADHRERADRPQAQERDPARALIRQRGGGPRLGQRGGHGLGGAPGAPEDQPGHDRTEPPCTGEDQDRVVRVPVGGDHGHRAERRRHAGDQQHRHAEQVHEEHQPA